MRSHYSFAFSRMTFRSNPYIPSPNFSIKNDIITQVSSHPSNLMNFQSNYSTENLNSTDTLIYYPIKGKTNNMQLPNNDKLYQIKGKTNDNENALWPIKIWT